MYPAVFLDPYAFNAWSYDLPAGDGSVLFTEKFLTQPGVKRIALECPVLSLHSLLNNFVSRGIKIEHIYDY